MSRPTKATPEMELAAAKETVAELVTAGHLTEAEAEDAAANIVAEGRYNRDGYKLAKALDDRWHWDCDLDMADILDGHSSALDDQIKAAQKAWFEAERPSPPVEIGTRVCFRWGREPHTGIVDAIYEYGIAQYTVRVDGDPAADSPSQSRAIINWEDVSPAPECAKPRAA